MLCYVGFGIRRTSMIPFIQQTNIQLLLSTHPQYSIKNLSHKLTLDRVRLICLSYSWVRLRRIPEKYDRKWGVGEAHFLQVSNPHLVTSFETRCSLCSGQVFVRRQLFFFFFVSCSVYPAQHKVQHLNFQWTLLVRNFFSSCFRFFNKAKTPVADPYPPRLYTYVHNNFVVTWPTFLTPFQPPSVTSTSVNTNPVTNKVHRKSI